MAEKKYIIDNPDLMAEWDWEKNNAVSLNPKSLTISSKKMAHWICNKGHTWTTTIAHRGIGGTNCPYCANKKILVGFNDLASQFPQLIEEWDWAKNNELNIFPQKVYFGSSKKVHWICLKGHSWSASINHRTFRVTNCPYCSNKKILAGYNDLKSQRPDLMEEWDFKRNVLDPEKIAVLSPKKAYWICSRGHNYEKPIYNRAKGIGCPFCTRAKSTSFPEQCFYYYIKKVYPDTISRYKDIFKNSMELDIYIPSARIGIEYDGIFWHSDKKSLLREETKYRICKENGIKLFRIKEGEFSGFTDNADDIYYIPKKTDTERLNFYIYELIKKLTFYSRKIPAINIERDKNEILEYMTVKYEESLECLFPKIAQEWHPTKNRKLTPDLFIAGSSEKIWWKCAECGNEWRSSIVNRTKGHGCDICATEKRKFTKKETLLSTRQVLDNKVCLLDWDYEANEHKPEYYTSGSGEKVHWKCHICGHKWETAICNRTRDYKNGCPLCSGKTIVSGVNDLFTRRPDLMEEWYWEGNAGIDPKKIGVGSHLYAYWKCKKCDHIWKSKIYNRSNGKGCPTCASRKIADLHRIRAISRNGSLKDTHPLLANEWHPTKNGEYRADMFSKGSDFKAWWICSKCQHEWYATIGSRCRGSGCPKCANKKK